MAFMILAGEEVDISVPLGEYEIFYTTGTTWYGNEDYFGKESGFYKCDGTFDFDADDQSVNGWTLTLYAVLSGVLYSFLMDIWTVLWADGTFNISRYLAAILSAVPFTAIYAVSNTVFLLLFARPIGKILDRLKTKYAL